MTMVAYRKFFPNCAWRACIRRLKAIETEYLPLVTFTPMAWEMDRRDLTNRVCHGPLWLPCFPTPDNRGTKPTVLDQRHPSD
jgi:hypothetical protein